jgi:sRNA-binding carbon storage regulator CsrA
MLVLKREESCAVLFLDADFKLIGFVAAVEAGRIGFRMPENVSIVRLELTDLAGLSPIELGKIPFGTVVKVIE